MKSTQQETLWDSIWEKYKITKPIRLIELFSGIGAQFKALKELTDKVESYKTCEWAYNSIIAYNSIHIKDNTDYTKDMSKEQLLDYLQGNISLDYNQPADLSKKSLEWLKTCYNSCIANHNLMNIMKVKAKDLEIVDKDKYEYIMTYSFPCQDLSLAGNRKGMSESQANGGTRSGLLWEVERLLDELNERERESLPQILLMENVPQVIGANSIKDFQKWEMKLERLGYQNYIDVINAKDYGIPQNRQRCFMISILGQSTYHFPDKMPLKYKLKDFLETNVDEKYYLSDKKIESISNWKAQQDPFETMDKTMESGITPTLTARGAGEEHSGMVLIDEKILNNKVKYGDGVSLFNSEQFGGDKTYNQISPTIKAQKVDAGVVIKDDEIKMYNPYNNAEIKDVAPTQLTNCGITTSSSTVLINNNLRIRKLTPLECIKLMGFEQKDYESMKQIGLSDMAIYHCAGDSIVVSCLIAIFSQIISNENNTKNIVERYVEKVKN